MIKPKKKLFKNYILQSLALLKTDFFGILWNYPELLGFKIPLNGSFWIASSLWEKVSESKTQVLYFLSFVNSLMHNVPKRSDTL